MSNSTNCNFCCQVYTYQIKSGGWQLNIFNVGLMAFEIFGIIFIMLKMRAASKKYLRIYYYFLILVKSKIKNLQNQKFAKKKKTFSFSFSHFYKKKICQIFFEKACLTFFLSIAYDLLPIPKSTNSKFYDIYRLVRKKIN